MASNKVRMIAIRALEDQLGRVSARQLVDAARATDHPLHDEFEWDDVKAGDAHRLEQARKILRSVRVVVHQSEHRVAAPAYMRDPVTPVGYVAINQLRSERENSLMALRNEIARVQAALERAKEIALALGLAEELEEVIGTVDIFVGRLRTGTPQLEQQPPN